MNLQTVLDNEILPFVEKPSRYLGNEVNAVRKDPDTVGVRLALVFPDLYDLGLGNLGVHILYSCLNQLDWAACERAYAPGVDLEERLRERDLPLFALESKDPLHEFDGIGFTLQSELTYTNILNILDLSKIPLRASDREDHHPLAFAGGPAVFNPEPLAPFMDFLVMGDGEDVIIEIAQVLRDLRGRSRQVKLQALSLLEGVYVPSLYPMETLEDGRIVPKEGYPKIVKRVQKDLNGSTFPVEYILPYTQQVHDRVSLEVLRGCTQGCRFCQAGMTTRPVRERTIENIEDLLERTLDATGYEDVSLVSLSTCDHSQVRQMVERVTEKARPRDVSVSLPSLRLDSYSVELADMVASTRRTGLTVAPEAASPRLRAVINKWIPDEDLLKMSNGAFERGWRHVKLYFMIGLPTERDDDIEAIADLAVRTVREGREINPSARVNLGVSTFVPKPFTPFQWARQIGLEETERRQDVLQQRLGGNRSVKFGRHDPEETFLEGLVSRGDRRAADLLELAYRKGCRFDAWREHLRFDLWQEAIAELGFDVEDALRERSVDERLPWDHIDILIDKQWFVDDWKRALVLEHAEDCRRRRCHKCGVIDRERELCASMLRDHIEGRKTEAAWERKPVETAPPADRVQRLWFRISRTGSSRLLSHLEATSSWIRALRRANAPLAYSQGFHPHPKVAFSAALPVGEETVGDYLDVSLKERVEPRELFDRLRATLPEGFGVLDVREVPLNQKALMAVSAGLRYRIWLPGTDRAGLSARVQALLDRSELIVQRRVKQKKRRRRGPATAPLDVRPMIASLEVHPQGDVPSVLLTTQRVGDRYPKLTEILPELTDQPERARILKLDTLLDLDGELTSVGEGWSAAR